jgi:predicted nucleic acid-binding protein
MNLVFVDAAHWIAVFDPKDSLHDIALAAQRKLETQSRFVTTDFVLTEFLNTFCEHGPHLRIGAYRTVRKILANPNCDTTPASRISFEEGLQFYSQREDKGYSVTDCISMLLMKARGIQEILTPDEHFKQEGFTLLL